MEPKALIRLANLTMFWIIVLIASLILLPGVPIVELIFWIWMPWQIHIAVSSITVLLIVLACRRLYVMTEQLLAAGIDETNVEEHIKVAKAVYKGHKSQSEYDEIVVNATVEDAETDKFQGQ